jgi:autotransporter-associated beta strand protein
MAAAAAAAAAVAVLGPSRFARAVGADTWVGNTDANFGTAANWTAGAGGSTPPATGDSLVFGAAGSAGATLTDNLMTPATYNINGITFNAGAAAFTINPATAGTNGFTLTNTVNNNSTNLQTINDNITMTAARTFNMSSGGGDLTVGGAINSTTATTNQVYTVGMTSGFGGTFTIGGTWTDAQTAGTVFLQANLGTTVVFNSTGSLTSSTSSGITLQGNGGTYLLQHSGAFNPGTAVGTITLRQGSVLVASAANAITGNTSIVFNSGLNGSGFADLQAAQNFTGAVTLDNGSVLRLDDANAAASSSLVSFVGQGTMLQLRNDASTTFNMGTGTGNFFQTTVNATIDVNQSSSGTNQTLSLNGMRNSGTNLFITGGGGYGFNTGNLTLTANGATTLLVPISATVTVPTVSSIGTSGTNTLQLDGSLSGNIVTAAIANGSNTVAVSKANINTWTMTGANTYTGTTSVNGGNLVISGASGTINTSVATVNSGGTLTLDNSAGVNTDRYGDANALTLNNGTLAYIGNGSGASTESINGLAVNVGANALNMTAGAGGATTFTSASLTRSNNATVTFTGASLGAAVAGANVTNVVFSATPTLTGGAGAAGSTTVSTLPYALVVDPNNGTLAAGSLATYDVNGVRALTASEYVTSIASISDPNNNLRLTAADSMASSQTINAMLLGGGASLAQAGNTLTLGAGTIAVPSGSASISGGTINSGAGKELIVLGGGSLTIGSVIADSGSGASALTLGGPGATTLTGVNTYTGNTILNSGTLAIGNGSALGSGGSLILNNPLATVIAAGGAQTISNPVSLNINNNTSATANNVGATIGGSNNLTLNGAVTNTAGANTTLTVNNTGTTTLAGGLNLSNSATGRTVTINGSGNVLISGVIANTNSGAATSNLVYAGTGTLTLTGVNTYTGTTTIGNVAAAVNNATAFGNMPAALEGAGTLKLDFSATGAPSSNIASTGALNMGGGTLTLIGKASTSNSQTFGGMNFGAEVNNINLTAGSSGSIVLNLGTLAKTGGGADNRNGVLVLSLPAGTQSSTNGVTISNGNTNGIINNLNGGSVAVLVAGASTVDFGVNSTGAAGGNVIPLSSYASAGSSTANVDVSTSNTGLNLGSAYTLHFGAGAVSGPLNVTLTGFPTLIGGGAVLVSPSVGSNNVTISGGAIDGLSNRGLNFYQFDPNNTLTVNSVIVDNGSAGGIGVDGNGGAVVFGGNNLYTGQTFVSGTTLSIAGNQNLGNQRIGAAIDLDNATLQATSTFGLYNGTSGNSNRNIGLSNRGGTIDVTGANNLNVAGYISGLGGLTKTNTGTLTLSGRGIYTGATAINGGSLVLTGSSSLSNTAVAVNGGATLAITGNTSIGAGTIPSGSLTVAGGSTLGTVGTVNLVDGGVDALTINGSTGADGITLGSATAPSALNFEIGTSTADKIALTNSALLRLNTGGAKVNLTNLSATAGNTYTLMSFGGLDPANTGSFTLGSSGGLTGTLNLTSNALTFTVTGTSIAAAYWTGAQNGVWNTLGGGSASNWGDAAGNDVHQLPVDATDVNFIAANGNHNLSTTLGADFTIKGLKFNSTASSSVTIGGANTLTLLADGITVDSGSGAHTINTTGSGGNAGMILGASQIWTNNSSNVFTVSSTIGGTLANSLTIAGSGSGGFLVSGNNTYGGGTTINAGGKVQIGNANALGTGAVTDNGTLDLNNLTTAAMSVSGSGTITNSAAGTATLTANGGTFTGTLSDGSGTLALTVAGGIFTLTGAQAYHGNTTINNAATLQLGNGSVNGSLVNSSLTNNGTLAFDNATALTYSATLSGTGAVAKNGPATLTLSGANNYQGGTTINGGVLKIGNTTALGTGSLNVASGTFDLNGMSPTISGLSGSGTIDNTGGGSVMLTVNTAGGSGFSGLIQNATGSLALVKSGSGSLTISGTANSYTGGTTASGGSLILSGSGAGTQLGAPGSVVTINSGAELQVPATYQNSTWVYQLTLNGTGVGGAGALHFTGASGRLGFGGSGTGSPPPFANGGFIAVADGAAIGADGGTISTPNLLGPVSGGGTNGWTKVGNGILQLEGGNPDNADTWTGPVTVAAGMLRGFHLSNSHTAIPGPMIINPAGTYSDGLPGQISSTSVVTNNGVFDIWSNTADVVSSETVAAMTGNGVVYPTNGQTLGSFFGVGLHTLQFTTGNGSDFSGVMSDGNAQLAVQMNNTATGSQILSGANTYTGSTTINGGKLLINGSISSPVTVGGGTANAASAPTIGGIGTIGSSVLVNAVGTGTGTAGHVAPGAPGATLGTLTIAGGLNLAAGSNADFTFGSSGFSSLVSVSGGLTIPASGSGSVTVNLTDDANAAGHGSIGAGTYKLFSFDSLAVAFDPSEFTIGTSPFASATYTFTEPTGNEIDLSISNIVVGGPANLVWNNTGASTPADGATWDIANNFNWNNGTAQAVYHEGDNVTFDQTGITAGHNTITITAAVNPGSVTVSNTSGTYTINGAAIAGSTGLTKTNAGTFVLNNVNTYTGNTTVSGGTLTIGATGAIASTNVTVASGATLNATGLLSSTANVTSAGTVTFGATGSTATTTIQLASLTITGGTSSITSSQHAATPKTLQPTVLSITGGGKLDITNNEVVSTGSVAAAQALIGNGTTGSVVTSIAGLALGYMDAGGGKYEIRATLLGDSDLDGKVNVADLANLAGNFGKTSGQFWINGDFDYNGNVNVADLADLAGNFGKDLTSAGFGGASASAVPAAAEVSAAAGAAVPEPASLGIIGAMSLGLLARRQRRNRHLAGVRTTNHRATDG